MRIKAAALLLAVVMAVLTLTGCTAPQSGAEAHQSDETTRRGVIILYDADGLKIEREGAETRIYDLVGDAEYTFTTRRVKRATSAAAYISEGKTATDTETLTIETVYGLIIVTEKATGETIYIR